MIARYSRAPGQDGAPSASDKNASELSKFFTNRSAAGIGTMNHRLAAVIAKAARIPGPVTYTSSRRIFCAPFQSTVFPNAAKFSRPEVRVMK